MYQLRNTFAALLVCATAAFGQFSAGGATQDSKDLASGFDSVAVADGKIIDISHARTDTNYTDSYQVVPVFSSAPSAGGSGENCGLEGRMYFNSTMGKLQVCDGNNYVSADDIWMPDSTISVNASGYQIIVGDLNDPAVMWDLDAFRAAESNSSYYRNGEGRFPNRYAITITTGQDSVVIWDRDDWSRWMVFKTGVNNYYLYGAITPTDIHFLDGILYVADDAGQQSNPRIDFVNDRCEYNGSGANGLFAYPAEKGIYLRNDNTHAPTARNTSLSIVNTVVNAVDAIRDPFGMPMADGSGRTAHWWGAATASDISEYNPYANAIYDVGIGQRQDAIAMTARGVMASIRYDGSTRYIADLQRSLVKHTADVGVEELVFRNNSTGAEAPAWGNSVVFQAIDVIEGGSGAGEEAPLALIGSDTGGMYLWHTKPSASTTGGAKVLFDATGQYPYEKGDASGAYHLEDLTDGSPYGLDLTKVGTTDPMTGTISMVYGSGYSATDGGTASFLKDYDSDFNFLKSQSVWVKSASATNPSAAEHIVGAYDTGGQFVGSNMLLRFETDGTLYAIWQDYNGGDAADGATDFYDGRWHHIVVQLAPPEAAGAAGSTFDMYVDGELHAQDASVHLTAAEFMIDTMYVGARHAGADVATEHFNGLIDHLVFSSTAFTAAEIRGMYQDGLKAMQSAVEPLDGTISADIDYVDCIPGYCLAGDEDSLIVYTVGATTLIPYKKYGTPNGTMADAVLWQEAGADSPSVFMVTNTRLQAVQPDPNLASRTVYQWPYDQRDYDAVDGGWTQVDSSGQQGIFWGIEDALKAANNAGLRDVWINSGSYYETVVIPAGGMTLASSGHARGMVSGEVNIITTDSDDGEAITINHNYVTVKGFAVDSGTGGTGGGYSCILINASGVVVEDIAFRRCDDHAIDIAGGTDNFIRNNKIESSDEVAIEITATDRHQIIGNHFDYYIGGSSNIHVSSGGNHHVISSNFSYDTDAFIGIDATSLNGIYDGNSHNGAISDAGTGWTNGGNENF